MEGLVNAVFVDCASNSDVAVGDVDVETEEGAKELDAPIGLGLGGEAG